MTVTPKPPRTIAKSKAAKTSNGPGRPPKKRTAICIETDCGKEFTPVSELQKKCPDCIAKANAAAKEKALKAAKEKAFTEAMPARRDRNEDKKVSDNQRIVKLRCKLEMDFPGECPHGGVFETTYEKYRKRASFCDTGCRDQYKKLKSKKYQQELEEKRRGNMPTEVIEIDYTPHPAQKEFHASTARFKVLVCGIRFGKDRACIQELIYRFAEMLSEKRPTSLVPRVHGWLVAPTFPLARQMWREIKEFFPQQWVVKKNEADLCIETVGGGLIEIKSATDPDSLVAVGLDIVILSEFAKVAKKEEVFTNIRARVSSPGRGPNGNGGIVLINSTPKGMDMFYDMYLWGQSDDPRYKNWKSFQYPTVANPHMNPEEIADAERTLPRRLFNQEYLAEFLRDGGEVFLNVDDASIGHIREPEPGMIYKAAWDPAEKLDFSSFGIRNLRGEQVYIRRWTGIPYNTQMDEAAYYCKLFNHATLEIDITAAGSTALVEGMIRRGVNAVGVVFTNAVKAQWVSHLSILFESRMVVLLRKDLNDDTDAQNKELKAYTYHYTSGDRISYHHPGSGHDDCVDMLLILYRDFHAALEVLPYVGLLLGASRQKQAV